MSNLETDIRQVLRECPNIVIEADQLRMLLCGNVQRIIDEYNDEDKKFSSLISEEIEEVPIDEPRPFETEPPVVNNLLMVNSTSDKREDEDLGDTQGEPDPNNIPQEAPVVHPDDQEPDLTPVDPDGLNDS